MTYQKTKNNQPLKIAVGTDNFKEMISDYDVYVDKSLFIKEILDSSEKAMLITYPRRWGKTLNLDMLKVFLEPENSNCIQKTNYEESFSYLCPWTWSFSYSLHRSTLCNKDLFIDNKLKISEVNSGYYMKFQGKHPVIYISLKEINGNNLEVITDQLKSLIKNLYKDFRYLLDNNKLHDVDRNDFKKYIDIQYDKIRLEDSISFLSGLLKNHYGQKVYVLVDEYDKPINSFLEDNLGLKKPDEENKLVIKISKLISDIFCSPLAKTNHNLEKLILTGIFDTIYKEAGSGCNNVSPYGITDIKFSKNFGFSKQEVTQLINKFPDQYPFDDKSKILEKITDWYDGYHIPISTEEYMHTYTPWAVMKYLNTAYSTKDLEPRNYWSKSGASTILQKLFTKEKCLNSHISNKFLELSTNKTFKLKFDNQISLFKYNWYHDVDNEEFFTYLLVNSGYFSVKKSDQDFEFSIPNAELLEEFKEILPRDDKQCDEILENLKKSNYLKAVNFIKSNDYDGFSKIFEEGKIKCHDYSMNFNFLQLSIIYSSNNIFNYLLNSTCIEELFNFKDTKYGLLPLDYAIILQKDSYLESFKKNYSEEVDMHINEYNSFTLALCYVSSQFDNYPHFSNGIKGATLFTLIGLIVDWTGYIKNYWVQKLIYVPGIISLFAGRSKIDDNNNIEYCKEYDYYQSINVTAPEKFETLQQYRKYIQDDQDNNTYASIGPCTDKELNSLDVNVFNNSVYSEEKIVFNLCEISAA